MTDDLCILRQKSLNTVKSATSVEAIENVRVALLGKKGEITQALKSVGKLPQQRRKEYGASINQLKDEISALIEKRTVQLLDSELVFQLPVDYTLPGMEPRFGGLHPITKMMYDLNDAFTALNFEVFEGPEISDEHHAFDNLNFPPDHPARESMDTYWLTGFENNSGRDRICLRPHLTGASVRYMQTHQPPFRIVYPGRVYRNESTDARHERAFFQYEALIVDRHMPFSAGQLLINTVLDTVFRRPVKTRMRAGFFPFVEPGFEIDMQCLVCSGSGCKVCKHVGWLEIMPGGAPHPNVFSAGGINPDEWMGFYVSVGLDRLVMMRYEIDDVRLFHSGDIRFLHQFI